MTTEAAQALDQTWVDWPTLVDWDGGRYREVIVTGRRWLELVVRTGPDADAVRAAGVLLAAGDVSASSRAALRQRFPQRERRA